jgi:hypothetical protein
VLGASWEENLLPLAACLVVLVVHPFVVGVALLLLLPLAVVLAEADPPCPLSC